MRRYLILILAALAAFGYCIRGSFHFDDYGKLIDPAVTSPDGFLDAWDLLQTRPLPELSFWMNYRIGETSPAGYHIFNLLVHLGVVCLLFHVLKKLIPENAAFLAAALFAAHPIQGEAIAYVYARSSLMAAFFCLLCWKFWLEGRAWLAVAWFALALLCKEEAASFPIVLLLFGPRRWKPFALMLALCAAAGFRAIYATAVIPRSGGGFSAGVTPLDYLSSEGAVILRYLRLTIVPWGFTFDPDLRIPPWERIVAWLWLLGAAAAAIRFRGKWLWFVAALVLLLPSSSLFPGTDLSADRRIYIPMIAFCALAGVLLSPARPWIQAAIAVVLIALSIGRMEVWRTDASLWAEAVNRAPRKSRPRVQLSRALPPDRALEVLRAAPEDADVSGERGRVYLLLRRPADALREFDRAVQLKPGDAYVLNNRGVARMSLGEREPARQDFVRALQLDPDLADAQENLRRIH